MRLPAGLATLLLFAMPLALATSADEPRGSVPDHLDSLGLNQFQSIGTHNSYHEQPSPALDDLMINVLAGAPDAVEAICPGVTEPNDCVQQLRYTHAPLAEQVGEMGIRQFELDVFADPPNEADGSTDRYLYPLGLLGVQDPPFSVLVPYDPDSMTVPGFKVFHVQDIDFRTNCGLFTDCLQRLYDWSTAHRQHPPILILIEAKDDLLPSLGGFSFVEPLEFTAQRLWILDLVIRSVFDSDRLITPNDVRGAHATLRQAVLEDGWPTLEESRGRFLFALDNGEPYISRYLEIFPRLQGAVMFTDSPTNADEAAFVKRNDPAASDTADLVAAGFLVRTRADADTQEALLNSTARREQAFASGAQYVSTDYPVPDLELSDYSVAFDGNRTVRCNPVNTNGETCNFDPGPSAEEIRCAEDLALANTQDQACRFRLAARALTRRSQLDDSRCTGRLGRSLARANRRLEGCAGPGEVEARATANRDSVDARIEAIGGADSRQEVRRCLAPRVRSLASHFSCGSRLIRRGESALPGEAARERCDARLIRTWDRVASRHAARPAQCATDTTAAEEIDASWEAIIGLEPESE